MIDRKDSVLFTRCGEKFKQQMIRYASRLAEKWKRPVSLAAAVRHALEQELEREER